MLTTGLPQLQGLLLLKHGLILGLHCCCSLPGTLLHIPLLLQEVRMVLLQGS